jgi:hypothetical protein
MGNFLELTGNDDARCLRPFWRHPKHGIDGIAPDDRLTVGKSLNRLEIRDNWPLRKNLWTVP